MQRAIDSFLAKSIRDAADAVLVSGTAASQWPFSGFLTLAAAFSPTAGLGYTSLVDGALAGAVRMRLQGFDPRIVVLSEAAYLDTQLKKDSTGRYLSDNYLKDLGLALGGMQVALSAGVTAGEAFLLDPMFCGCLSSGATRISLGFVNDQVTKNMVTVKGEVGILPTFTDFQGAALVTPPAT